MEFNTLRDSRTGRVFTMTMIAQNGADELFLTAMERVMTSSDEPATLAVETGTHKHFLKLGPELDDSTDRDS